MGQLSEIQLASVRALLSAAPDGAVRALEATLASGSERHATMRMIQGMVAAEALDRRARNAVFGPITPLCTSARSSLGGIIFPSAALSGVWNGLKTSGGRNLQQAINAAQARHYEAPPSEVYDQLCADAAAGLRERSNPGYEAAAAALENAMPGGAERFAAYLDVTPVARSALDRMHEWLGRLNEARSAAARLAFKDATAVAEDAGPRLLEILYAHLEEPWAVLRLVSAVMHRPADKFVASSELAGFGERLLDDIDARLARVAVMDADGGRAAGLEAGASVRHAGLVIQEFDECIELSPTGPWGSRLMRCKKALVQAVEGRLKGAEAEVAAALPVQTSGARRRGVRGHPRLNSDPDLRHVERARAFLTLLQEVRPSAERLGFGSLWGKTSEQVRGRLDTYIEDLLEMLREHETSGEGHDRVRLYLDIAAEFLGLVTDDRAAQIVRRRMAAAA
jgi:hypothetical protein